MYSLGLDIGTTTICAVVADTASGEIVRSVTLPNDTRIDGAPYEKLQSPMLIVRKSLSLVDSLADAYAPLGSIGVTGQMHGILYYDKAGNAVSPLFIWQDGSGDQPFTDGETYAEALTRLTGCPMASGFGACTAFVHHHQRRIPAGAAGFCTIHDYVAMRLTHTPSALCHVSDAASFGLFDVREGAFDEAAIESSGLSPALFPAVTADFAVVGQYRGNIPVACAIGDNQASFIGAVSDPAESVLVNLGTGGQVSYMTDAASDPALEVRPLGAGQYIAVGASLCGGSAFAALERFLRQTAHFVTGNDPGSAYAAIDRFLADSAPDEDDLTVDTRFSGTRQNPRLRGSITGIGLDNLTPQHLIRGVMQGIVTELQTMYLAGRHDKKSILVCSGNGLRKNPALRTLFAYRFGMQPLTPVHTEEAAFGAALAGMVASGAYASLSEAQQLIRYSENK